MPLPLDGQVDKAQRVAAAGVKWGLAGEEEWSGNVEHDINLMINELENNQLARLFRFAKIHVG